MFHPGVLIISGNKPRSRLIQIYLREAGFDVYTLESGEDALLVINKLKPRLVVLDFWLSNPGSLVIIQRIRADERNKKLPLVLTGLDMDSEERLRGLEAGADLCLEDPFQGREFIARVNALMRRVYPPDSPRRSLDSI